MVLLCTLAVNSKSREDQNNREKAVILTSKSASCELHNPFDWDKNSHQTQNQLN